MNIPLKLGTKAFCLGLALLAPGAFAKVVETNRYRDIEEYCG